MAVKPAQRQRPVDLHALARPGLQPEPGAPAQNLEEVYGKVFRALHAAGQRGCAEAAAIGCSGACTSCSAQPPSACRIKALRAMAETDFGVNTSTEQVMHLMVPFFAAGMRAGAASTIRCWPGAQLRPRNKTPAKGLIADGAPGRRFPFSFLCAPGGTPCARPAPLAGARYRPGT